MKTYYYIIENKKENGHVVMQYVATSEKKAIEFLKKQFNAEKNGAYVMGIKLPVDTTDDGFFYYNGGKGYQGGEWSIHAAPKIW